MMTVILLAATGFAATNVDNLLLLVSWLLGGKATVRSVFAGYALAVVAVLLVALSLGQVSNIIPVHYIGFLGAIPVLLGLKLLIEKALQRQSPVAGPTAGSLSFLSVATVLFANSVDTMLVFSPLLADSNPSADVLVAASYVVVALGWFSLAWFLSRNAARLQRVSAVAQWVAPLIMIAVGFYILDNTATDVIAGS